MKIALIYLYVAGKSDPTAPPPEHYAAWSERFIQSWLQYAQDVEHDLIVVSCGGPLPESAAVQLRERKRTLEYTGGGWDIGAHQYALREIQDFYDFALCLNTAAHFKAPGFMAELLKARLRYGDGMYGASGSFENNPHIRTPCWACDPKTFMGYPLLVDDRAKTFEAESGVNSITNWYRIQGKPTMVVGGDGCFELMESRGDRNTFRHGDQSADLVWDRHHLWFMGCREEVRNEFQSRADGNPAKLIEYDPETY